MKLGELIEKRRAELGGRKPLTYQELSDRARSQGYSLADATLSAFVVRELAESPRRRTMRGLAVALAVSYNQVVEAVAESLLDEGDTLELAAEESHVRAWVTLTEGRTEQEREALLDVAQRVAAALDTGRVQEAEQDETRDPPGRVGTPGSANGVRVMPRNP